MLRRTACLTILACVLSTGDARSPLKQDERIIFFPTWGWQSPDGTWNAHLHGWVFEPETESTGRKAALGALRIALGLDAGAADTQLFKDRARAFLVDNERGKTIYVRIGSGSYDAGTSGANGHFSANVKLEPSAKFQPGTVSYRAILADSDKRVYIGTLYLVAPEGVSVISDIDDTIKDSHVLEKRELLANTFLREYRPVPKMAEAYRKWKQAGAQFHYVSGSPWQLYEPLTLFLEQRGFPAGTLDLRPLRLKDLSAVHFLKSPLEAKLATIEPVLKAFPKRRFILVGDSGEQDPEVYATLARKYPQQIKHIFIRNVTDEDATAARYQQTFEKLPRDQWTVFDDPQELSEYRP